MVVDQGGTHKEYIEEDTNDLQVCIINMLSCDVSNEEIIILLVRCKIKLQI